MFRGSARMSHVICFIAEGIPVELGETSAKHTDLLLTQRQAPDETLKVRLPTGSVSFHEEFEPFEAAQPILQQGFTVRPQQQVLELVELVMTACSGGGKSDVE